MGRIGHRNKRVGPAPCDVEREARTLVQDLRAELTFSLRLERVLAGATEADRAALRRVISLARWERDQAAARQAQDELMEAFMEGANDE